jgi:metallophosphoesterase (TIGR00282 family)
MYVNILCIGDVVGKAGRSVLAHHLPDVIKEHDVEFVVCNAENAAGGSGLTPQIFEKLQRYGVDVVTLGDHCYRKSEIVPVLTQSDRIVRPANLSPQSPGKRWTIVESRNGHRIGVACVLGQLNMGNADSPWDATDSFLHACGDETKIRILDFHGETTSEKIAIGWHVNGRASVVFGTHTHVPTADIEVLNKGTAFVSDLGMTGPYDSILGRRKDRVLKFMTTHLPQRFEVATADPRSYMMLATVETSTGRATACRQIVVRGDSITDGPYDSDDRA